MHNIIPANADCLIYNDYGDGDSRRFIKHILRDVYWELVKGENNINIGVSSANSVFMATELKEGYTSPSEWKQLEIEDVQSGQYFTIAKGDVLIFGTPNAPDEFTSTVEIDKYFGADYTHLIMSVEILVDPRNRKSHHIEVKGE